MKDGRDLWWAIKAIDAYYFRCYVLTCKCTVAGLMGRFMVKRINSTTNKRPKPEYLKTETRSRFFCQTKKWQWGIVQRFSLWALSPVQRFRSGL